MKFTGSILASAIVLAAAVAFVQPASAGIINYADQTVGGVTISQITERNDGPAGASYYGQPSFNGSTLVFSGGSDPFEATATSAGGGAADSLTAELTFVVTSATPINPSAFLSEFGAFSGYNGGIATVAPSVFIEATDGSGSVLASGSSGLQEFTAAPLPAGTNIDWSGSAGAAAAGALNSFEVIVDNDLTAVGPAGPVASSATIDKKGVSITIGQGGTRPPVPEPASLSLLGAGAVALIARRRKA